MYYSFQVQFDACAICFGNVEKWREVLNAKASGNGSAEDYTYVGQASLYFLWNESPTILRLGIGMVETS